MDKKVTSVFNSGYLFFNSSLIPILFFSIPMPSPIPGAEVGVELNTVSDWVQCRVSLRSSLSHWDLKWFPGMILLNPCDIIFYY